MGQRETEKELDALVFHAWEGDARAIGAIAIAFGPWLLGVARAELGERAGEEAVRRFLNGLVEAPRGERAPEGGRAREWMVAGVLGGAEAEKKAA